MEQRLLRRNDVMRLTGLAKATIYRLMQRGDFPIPIKLGERAVAWRSDELDEWISSRERASIGRGQ